MKTSRILLSACAIGASVALVQPTLAQQVDADIGIGGIGATADVSLGGSGGTSADANVSVGGLANADANLGLGDTTTASIDANIGANTDASVDLNVGDGIALDADVGLLGGSPATGGGTAGAGGGTTPGAIVAGMSGGDVARYRKPCREAVSASDFPAELRELCRLILAR